MNRKAYSYCFLRYRQDPESEEFANIGLALWSRELRFLAFRGAKRHARLKHFFGELDERGFHCLMEHLDRRFQKAGIEIANSLPLDSLPDSVLGWAHQMIPQDDGSLVWGGARGGLTVNPEQELESLFERHIGRHFPSVQRPNRNDQQVYRDVYRGAFENPIVAPRIVPHEVHAPLADHCFEQAWRNGVWHVYETLSFDLLDPDSIDSKAHDWSSRGTQLAKSPDRPRIHYLLGQPTLEKCRARYDRAKAILSEVPGVVLVQEDDAEAFAVQLEAQVKGESVRMG